jgi:hypothetical protein
LVITLSFWKSTQIFNFLFFFDIMTIRENQVASFIRIMNHVASNLSKSCFTIVT